MFLAHKQELSVEVANIATKVRESQQHSQAETAQTSRQLHKLSTQLEQNQKLHKDSAAQLALLQFQVKGSRTASPR